MKLKTYETPVVDLLLINAEVSFCASGGVPDMTVDPYTPVWS